MTRRITLLLLCSVGLWGCGAAGRYLGPTVHGYSFHASAVPSGIFLPSDVFVGEFSQHGDALCKA